MMTDSINADAATLAGLQIDFLQKFRGGQVTLNDFKMFLNLSAEDRAKRFGDWNAAREEFIHNIPSLWSVWMKFTLLEDFGVIVVPEEYDHATYLTSFEKQNRGKFWYYDKDITDTNFSNPSRILKAGDRLQVKAFKQIVPGETLSAERIVFLHMQNAVYTGAQGAGLVFEQRCVKLQKGMRYVSFDKVRLCEDVDLGRRVPVVVAKPEGDFRFDLESLGRSWNRKDAFLCFCELPSDT
jgi:hypothetical protein